MTRSIAVAIAKDFDEYLDGIGVKHIRGRALHPLAQGKIERYHRSMKNVVKLENYFFPWVLKRKLEEFVDYYYIHRYHESLDNLTPADVYFGRGPEILKRRMETKTKTIIANTGYCISPYKILTNIP